MTMSKFWRKKSEIRKDKKAPLHHDVNKMVPIKVIPILYTFSSFLNIFAWVCVSLLTSNTWYTNILQNIIVLFVHHPKRGLLPPYRWVTSWENPLTRQTEKPRERKTVFARLSATIMERCGGIIDNSKTCCSQISQAGNPSVCAILTRGWNWLTE